MVGVNVSGLAASGVKQLTALNTGLYAPAFKAGLLRKPQEPGE